jgi:H+-transporting ATPase
MAGFARRDFRSLGVAKTDSRGQWQFLGVMPLYDPPRSDAQATLAEMGDMGVQVKMVTGDQVAIAQEIAQQLGLGRNIFAELEAIEAVTPEDIQRVARTTFCPDNRTVGKLMSME